MDGARGHGELRDRPWEYRALTGGRLSRLLVYCAYSGLDSSATLGRPWDKTQLGDRGWSRSRRRSSFVRTTSRSRTTAPFCLNMAAIRFPAPPGKITAP